jgi:hypothetical protein
VLPFEDPQEEMAAAARITNMKYTFLIRVLIASKILFLFLP